MPGPDIFPTRFTFSGGEGCFALLFVKGRLDSLTLRGPGQPFATVPPGLYPCSESVLFWTAAAI